MDASVANVMKRPPDTPLQNNDQKRLKSDSSGTPVHSATPAFGTQSSDVAKVVAEARARAAAAAERLKGLRVNGDQSQPFTSTGNLPVISKPLSKIEEMRARVAALTGRSKISDANADMGTPARADYHQQLQHRPLPLSSASTALGSDERPTRTTGGLSAALHPALLETGKPAMSSTNLLSQNARQLRKSKGNKKQLDLSGPNLDEFRHENPFFDASLGDKTATLRSRNAKHLKFNEKGKYIKQAASLRRLEALEAMKKRIAASARKALVEDDVAEKKFLVEAPPDIEWWDEGLVSHPERGYGGFNEALFSADFDAPGLKILSSDSIITRLIQHPVLLAPPSERMMPAPKPMYLTTTEQRKIRRQRRMADLKESQAKIRLGLVEPPPDKVKLGNLMRVLGEEAVKDPTAVEARVNKQIAERKATHDLQNDERKLTDEQRHEKLEQKKNSDAAKGIYFQVYKIDSLANGRNRYKVSKNCDQLGGTGLCIFNPKFCLVLVEFGEHGAKAYKKLMTSRIDWTENSPSLSKEVREGNKAVRNAFLEAEDEKGQVKDLTGNQCHLVFEGQVKDRLFRKWTIKVCETDKEAMDALSRTKMDSFWTMAKSVS